MRWFLAILIILALVALDRAYMGGQNTEFVLSLARRLAATINAWANELVRSIRR